MIDAAKALAKRGLSDVRFILAGDEQGRVGYAKEIDERIAAAGLTGIVRRVGHCADMPAAFLAATVVCVPSIEPEAFGRSAVEAQAMGVPVVVTDIGAAPETVLAPPQASEAERTGWRVPPDDVDARSPTPSRRRWPLARASARRSPPAPAATWKAISRSRPCARGRFRSIPGCFPRGANEARATQS